MKKHVFKWVAFLCIVVMFVSCSPYQGVSVGVRVRPNAPVYARPVRPAANYVWIDGDWIWRNGAYVYKQGYWMQPRYGQVYIPGHWKNTRFGWQWVPGSWMSRRRW